MAYNTGGTQTNGTASLQYAGVPATAEAYIKYGSGYSSLPAISIQPVSGGSGAHAYFVGAKSEAKLLLVK